MSRTKDYRNKLLREVADNWDRWSLLTRQEKAIYHVMNLFNYDVTSKALIAEGWVPTRSLGEVQQALAVARVRPYHHARTRERERDARDASSRTRWRRRRSDCCVYAIGGVLIWVGGC
jgi:vacuolar-type H+-ATPase subunit I/STV1